MSLTQGFSSTFSTTQTTIDVLHNLDNETKKIYNDVNAIMAADGHSHTGNGSDGALLDFSNPTTATHQPNPVSITSATGVLTLLETSNSFIANGTEAITSIAGWTKGIAYIRWNTVRTLTYNATSLILQNSVDRVTKIGDMGIYEITATGVREVNYFPITSPVVGSGVQGSFKNLKITNNTVIAFTGNTTSASTSVTSVSSTVGLVVGMQIFGAGIQTGTTISVIGSGTITLSITATATATGVSLTAGYCNTQTVITADQVVLFNSANTAYLATSVSLTADTSVSGVNGLDTGTKAVSTWYSVWVIAKADGTKSSLLSLSETTPTMPTDYVYKARIGWIRTSSSGYLMRILQVGRKARYVLTPSTNTNTLPLMTNTTTSVAALVSTTSFAPTTTLEIKVLVSAPASTNYGIVGVSPNNSYTVQNSCVFAYNQGTILTPLVSSGNIMLESNNIYFIFTNNGGSYAVSLYCLGWEDNM